MVQRLVLNSYYKQNERAKGSRMLWVSNYGRPRAGFDGAEMVMVMVLRDAPFRDGDGRQARNCTITAGTPGLWYLLRYPGYLGTYLCSTPREVRSQALIDKPSPATAGAKRVQF